MQEVSYSRRIDRCIDSRLESINEEEKSRQADQGRAVHGRVLLETG